MNINFITKSNFLSFLKCHKKLWLEKYRPELIPALTDAERFIIEQGYQVEALAKKQFPVAVQISKKQSVENRVKDTYAAINNGAKVVFEASFLVDGLFAAIDVLEITEGGWAIYEIKSSSKVKEEHLLDVAYQYEVLRRAEFNIKTLNIVHLNGSAVWSCDENLFSVVNVTENVIPFLSDIDKKIISAKVLMNSATEPRCDFSRSCNQNGGCPFKPYCWKNVKEHTVFDLGMHWKRQDKLLDQGMFFIKNVPLDFLNENELIAFNVLSKNKPYVDAAGIKRWLSDLKFPIHFFDFESCNPAIPVFDGAKSYQQIPFQFSCHILHENGFLEHKEFLHTEPSDPRELLIQSIISAISEKGSVVVYHKQFEQDRLTELMERCNLECQLKIESIINRLLDLEDIFKLYYKAPEFKGRTSIKVVLPVLAPDLSYKTLNIQAGQQATVEWLKMIASNNHQEKQKIETDLKKYCQLDTYAMYAIYLKLLAMVK